MPTDELAVADPRGLQALDGDLETLDTAPLIQPLADEDAFYDHVVEELCETVGRAAKFVRLRTGSILFTAFGGDEEAYASRASNKRGLRRFLNARREELGRIGINRTTAQEAIAQWIVWRTLPDDAKSALGLTALVHLYRLKDSVTRHRFAHEAVVGQWSARRLRNEIDRHLLCLAPPPKDVDPGTPHGTVVRLQSATRDLLGLDVDGLDLESLRVGDRVHLRQLSISLRALCDRLDARLNDGDENH